ncbi:ATP-binding protein [Paenibacillus taichungensis]|uniref:ATP-binding protein n=1 Tax=Paenibacillus taichungensis TaxID=484184 RepID=UPI00382EF80E
MTTINRQSAYGNSTIYNAEQINNNIFDNPLKFFCDKKISEDNSLKSPLRTLQFLINKDRLKLRFSGDNFKYNELVSSLHEKFEDKTNIDHFFLDDGYKSVINCIVKTVFYFDLEENTDRLQVIGTHLYAEITDAGLRIHYSEDVKTYELYIETKRKAEKIIQELSPFINCATQYGNFFQFSNVFIGEIKDVPFITEEIKFHVSNRIIPNLIKPLYGDSPECGLREIIQNACDATKELPNNNDSKVEVHLFRENETKKIRVRDYGIGMTKDVLMNKYFVIGESSKKNSDLNLVGQFGIGALAAFLLGDTVEVRTKNYKEEILYCFTYKLDTNQESSINISVEHNSDFSHGTEITINLNKELSVLTEKTLKDKLKMDTWYVLPNIPIQYYVNFELEEIQSFTGEQYEWRDLEIPIDSIEVAYLDHPEKNYASQVILNGLIVPEKYKLQCKFLKKMPFISIQSYKEAMKMNLERSKIEDGLNPVLRTLEKHFIKKGLDQLLIDRESIVSSTRIINRFNYQNEFLTDIPLFFCKTGFGIFSSNTIGDIKGIDTIVRVYGYNGYPLGLDNLSDNTIYLFYNSLGTSGNISDVIESFGTTYVPIKIIEQFFYNASSQYNGFRFNAMKKLYESLINIQPLSTKANDFWSEHKQNKEVLFRGILNERKDIVIGYDNKEIVEGIREICKSAIINVSSLDNSKGGIIYDDINVGLISI